MHRMLRVVFTALSLAAILLTACNQANQPNPPSTSAPTATTAPQTQPPILTSTVVPSDIADTPTAEPEAGEDDYSGLIAALEAAGATVEAAGRIEQPFFLTAGQAFAVNGGTIQVFPYPNATAAEAEAAQVAPDGSSVGASMISWMEPPHFYRQDRLIVLYVGEDADLLTLLESVFGPQFAGA